MPRQHNRALLGLIGRYLVLVAVLGLVATSVYAAVDVETRPAVLRLAVAAFVTIVLIHLHSRFRRQLEEAPPSPFDQARRGQPAQAKVAPIVIRLQREVQDSVASQRFFKSVLWPRLVHLAEQRGDRELLHDLDGRPRRRRGPSLSAIDRLVRRIGDER